MDEASQAGSRRERILLIWREMLASPDAGPHDNFFDAGGTSLVAARLAGRIASLLDCKLTAADILTHPTVEQLANRLAGREEGLDRTAAEDRAARQRGAFAVGRRRQTAV